MTDDDATEIGFYNERCGHSANELDKENNVPSVSSMLGPWLR
jgi:hypothetical protein